MNSEVKPDSCQKSIEFNFQVLIDNSMDVRKCQSVESEIGPTSLRPTQGQNVIGIRICQVSRVCWHLRFATNSFE